MGTVRERVVELVMFGRTNHEIAEALGVSEKTVEWHLSRLYRERGVRSRTELVVLLLGQPDRPHKGQKEE